MKLDPDYTVVSDFSANGPTRGAIFPVLDMAGEVVRPRKPDDPMTGLTELDLTPSEVRPTPVKPCLSCGVDISSRRCAKRCVSCAEEKVLERSRRWKIDRSIAQPEAMALRRNR